MNKSIRAVNRPEENSSIYEKIIRDLSSAKFYQDERFLFDICFPKVDRFQYFGKWLIFVVRQAPSPAYAVPSGLLVSASTFILVRSNIISYHLPLTKFSPIYEYFLISQD